ncbi:MAG TPA: AAA family ATPase [Dehalococcoidia bacterium]|nr:AAA family ATPase [Dehalococcoidia bacterium]
MTAAPDRSFVSPVLIGRAAQLDVIRRCLDRAFNGEPVTVLLSGEAGIGKSRLVAETAAAARSLGFSIIQGNCFEQDAALPYSAILELLRSGFTSQQEDLMRLIGPLSGEIAKIAPELLPGVVASPVVDPDQEKRRVFHALAQVFVRLASRRPLLIVIEDLHWSDETTQQFLTYFARQLTNTSACPILLLLTYRAEEIEPGLEHFLAGVERQRLAAEVDLTPLTRAEVDVMIRAILGLERSVRRDFLDRLYERTDGNPFFVEEILKSVVGHATPPPETEELERRLVEVKIPRTVRDAVRQRAARLSEGAHRLLDLAAVAGQRFDLRLLQRLTAENASSLVDKIKELLAAQLVVEESGERFRFRHALTREAIYSNLLGVQRTELHHLIAEEIEEGVAGSPERREGQLAELAFHFYEGQAWGKALLYCQEAGRRAQHLFTPSASVQHLSRAIEASRRHAGTVGADLYRLRAAAFEILGQFENALADHEMALVIARELEDREEEWEILLGLGMLWSARDYTRTREYYASALDLARTLGDQRLIARSLNRVGNYLANVEEPDEGIAHHEEALRIFETLADAEGIAETVDLLGVAWLLGGNLARSRAYYERALQLFEEYDDRQGCVSVLTVIAVLTSVYHTDTLPPAATFAEAAEWLARAHRVAVEVGWSAGECFALWNMGACLGSQGEFADALRHTLDAIAIAEDIEHLQWLGGALFVLGAIEMDVHDFQAARADLERAVKISSDCGSLFWTRTAAGFLARCYMLEGQQASAKEVLDSVLPEDAPAQTLGQRVIHSARAELMVAQGQPGDALQLLDRLEAGFEPGVIVPRLAKLRADALALRGDYAEAESLYLRAAAQAEQHGAFAQVWVIRAALASMHEKAGEREKARQAYGEAVRTIDQLAASLPEGSQRDSFRTSALRRLPSLRPLSERQSVKQAFGGLTEREREVAVLIAAGRTNAAIGEALVISERTVETHVTNILGKLGFASRAQIATWTTERGMSMESAPH